MIVDPRNLKPSEARRLLNTTALGEVLTTHGLRRMRERAGAAIGGERRVDLVALTAWMLSELRRRTDEAEPGDGLTPYERQKRRAAQRQREIALAGRDIGDLPEVGNPRRRDECRESFRRFCEVYFPEVFCKGWSPDHLRIIGKIERIVKGGGTLAIAMPRASGKTSLLEAAVLWAVLYGYRVFVVIIGASDDAAMANMQSVKSELENNELLAEDFPEVCVPIHRIDGLAQRASGQLYRGKRTNIEWGADTIVLPTIPGSPSSGAIVRAAGITSQIRGAAHKRPDGSKVRPDLVFVDDPQTDESARSAAQVRKRLRIVKSAVLGLAGPGEKIAAFAAVTVVVKDDLADQLLSHKKNPAWQGERTKLIYKLPVNDRLWAEYDEVRRRSLEAGLEMKLATEFYEEHREKLDEGAEVAWESRFNPDEASAIQHAMNIKLEDEHTFASEYQNEPLSDALGEEEALSPDDIVEKLNGLPRRYAPIGTTRLTAFIDVQLACLFYVVAAWADDFTGAVIDYGCFPDQGSPYFSLGQVQHTLADKYGEGFEANLYAGLEDLTTILARHEFPGEDGTPKRIEKIGVDAGWGKSTETIRLHCRQSANRQLLVPMFGRYVGAASEPMASWKKRDGDRVGFNWRVPGDAVGGVRHLLHDTNAWKSFVHSRFRTGIGSPGALTLWGDRISEHRMYADHLTAEYAVRTEGRGRQVDEWKLRVAGSDNHLGDCTVGCAVLASYLGAALPGHQPQRRPKKRRAPVTWSEEQRKRREERERGRGRGR